MLRQKIARLMFQLQISRTKSPQTGGNRTEVNRVSCPKRPRWPGGVSSVFIVLLVLVSCFRGGPSGCFAKGVHAPTSPTDEYLASFFEPSSADAEDLVRDIAVDIQRDEAVDDFSFKPTTAVVSDHDECVCECEARPTISTQQMLANAASQHAEDAVETSSRLDEMEGQLVAMETRLADVEKTNHRLKKLGMAAMSVAIADEGERCTEAEGLGVQQLIKGFPAFTVGSSFSPTVQEFCVDLGTIIKPATSCNQLKLGCNKPSGVYFLDNGYFTQVTCEMDLHGGGWARYGVAGKQSEWNFVDENLIEVRLQIMDPSDVKEMIDMNYNTFRIHTDVTFSLQADDSTNPSRVTARVLPWFNRAAFYIDGYGENFTRLEFLPSGDRITCRISPGTSHKCGWGQVPKPNEPSEQVLIESVYFGPRATANGASTYMDDWEANRFTWNGSYYYVYAK